MLTLGVGLGMFAAGVLFADKIKALFTAKTAAVKADVAAEVTKVEAKL